jgi:uncharacterized SAM-binding protein YcdF (DUF218 family)
MKASAGKRSAGCRLKRSVTLRESKLKRRLFWLAIVFVLWWLIAWLGARALIVETVPPARADAIVVMSGSSALKERTRAAAQLFAQSKAPLVVLTNDGQQGGWSNEKERNLYTYERATDELVRLGVPASNIRVLPQVVNGTYEEVGEIKDWKKRERVGPILVVTSAYHSRRTRWSLAQILPNSGSEAQLVTVPPGYQTPRPATWWWYPSGWRSVGAEYVKFAYYLVAYHS